MCINALQLFLHISGTKVIETSFKIWQFYEYMLLCSNLTTTDVFIVIPTIIFAIVEVCD